MGDYRSLHVWHRAHALALRVYNASQGFPRGELYGLTSQVRRAAVSIPSNLAEGCGRNSDAEIARFARISLGSASELEYQLLLARDLGFLDRAEHRRLDREIQQIRSMLARLATKLAGHR